VGQKSGSKKLKRAPDKHELKTDSKAEET